MFTKFLAHLRQQSLGALALFIVLGGTSYAVATGSIDSREIRNNTIRGKDVRTNTLRGADINESSLRLAVAKGFATINGQGTNGSASVLNFGGQQTATDPPGVSAERQFSGTYLVTFRGRFANVDSVDDLAIQATGENFSNASAEGISANEDQVVIRVRLRNFNGAAPANEDFTVQFTTS